MSYPAALSHTARLLRPVTREPAPGSLAREPLVVPWPTGNLDGGRVHYIRYQLVEREEGEMSFPLVVALYHPGDRLPDQYELARCEPQSCHCLCPYCGAMIGGTVWRRDAHATCRGQLKDRGAFLQELRKVRKAREEGVSDARTQLA